MIFTKRIIRTTSIPKIWKIRRSIWKIKAKNLQICKFWPKNGQILVTNGQILAISEFSRHIQYDFLKKTTRVVSIRKIMKVYSGVGRYRPKTLKNGLFGQIWPNFDHFWPFWGTKVFEQKNHWWSSKSYGDTT